jgi:hypothetical protein
MEDQDISVLKKYLCQIEEVEDKKNSIVTKLNSFEEKKNEESVSLASATSKLSVLMVDKQNYEDLLWENNTLVAGKCVKGETNELWICIFSEHLVINAEIDVMRVSHHFEELKLRLLNKIKAGHKRIGIFEKV